MKHIPFLHGNFPMAHCRTSWRFAFLIRRLCFPMISSCHLWGTAKVNGLLRLRWLLLPLSILVSQAFAGDFQIARDVSIKYPDPGEQLDSLKLWINGAYAQASLGAYYSGCKITKMKFAVTNKSLLSNPMLVEGKDGDQTFQFEDLYTPIDTTNSLVRSTVTFLEDSRNQPIHRFTFYIRLSSDPNSSCEVVNEQGKPIRYSLKTSEVPLIKRAKKITVVKDGLMASIQPGSNSVMQVYDTRLKDESGAISVYVFPKQCEDISPSAESWPKKGAKVAFETKVMLKRAH